MEKKKQGLIAGMKETHFSIESIAMILIGFTCTGTFQLWLNCAQNFAKDVAGWVILALCRHTIQWEL